MAEGRSLPEGWHLHQWQGLGFHRWWSLFILTQKNKWANNKEINENFEQSLPEGSIQLWYKSNISSPNISSSKYCVHLTSSVKDNAIPRSNIYFQHPAGNPSKMVQLPLPFSCCFPLQTAVCGKVDPLNQQCVGMVHGRLRAWNCMHSDCIQNTKGQTVMACCFEPVFLWVILTQHL